MAKVVLKKNVGKHRIDGKLVEPGEEIELTQSQIANIGDKFEVVLSARELAEKAEEKAKQEAKAAEAAKKKAALAEKEAAAAKKEADAKAGSQAKG